MPPSPSLLEKLLSPFKSPRPDSQSTQQPRPVCIWSTHAPQSGPSPSPFPRSCYTLTATALATAAGEFFLFGGCEHSGHTSGDLYVFSTRDISTTLLQTSGEVPTPRASHGAALFGTTLLICGGSTTNPSDRSADSLYLLNLESRKWSRVVVNGPGPDPRIFHTTAVVGSKLFVFGGEIGGNSINDMWTLDLNNLKSQPVWESYESTPGNENPLPRSRHASVTTEGRIIIFGGYGDQHYYNDTWSFDILTRKWTELQCTGSIPSPRASHAAVLVDDVMYVFGGFSRDEGYLGDSYALQFSTQRWFKFHNVGPSPHGRSTHAMASDGTRVFVLGGYSKGARADDLSHIHFFDTKFIVYPELERNAVNLNEKTTQLARKSSTGPTLEQPQDPESSSSEDLGSSRQQNATAVVSSRPASKPRQVPEDGIGEASSTEYHGKSAAPHSSVEGEFSRLEFERPLSVLLAAQIERDQRIAQLTDELTLKSALLEQSEANATEATKRAGLHADRLLMQTSLVEQRDAELVDMQARLDELQLSRDQQEVALQELRSLFSDSQTTVLRLESENKRITRQLNEAIDQHRYEAERLKDGIEDLKANHGTAIERARMQVADLQHDKSDSQLSLDTLKAETARSNRRLPRMGSPMTPQVRERSELLNPNDRELDDVSSLAPSTSRKRGDTSSMFPADGNVDSSPDVFPSRSFQAPNHPSDEVEALQQYEKELTNARAKLEAKEFELEAVRSRLTDAENGWTKSKAGADTLRAQNATGSVNRDEDQVIRRLLDRVRALEAEMVSKRWNEKRIEEMECRNEG